MRALFARTCKRLEASYSSSIRKRKLSRPETFYMAASGLYIRVKAHRRAKYAALMSDLPERNGWTLAERAGDRTPTRMQRLLDRAVWDKFAAMAVVRRFAVTGLDEAACRAGRRGLAVGAVD
jgi:hypothetical protein